MTKQLKKAVSVSNNKGGVGKTFISSHIFYYAAQTQKSVFISLDTQKSTEKIFDADRFHLMETSLLFEESFDLDIQDDKSLVFIGDPSLNFLGKEENKINSYRKLFYANLLKIQKQGYEFIVIDTPPAEGEQMTLGLLMSNFAVVPFLLDTLSIEGIRAILAKISKIKQVKPNFEFLGLLPNKHQKKSEDEKKKLESFLKDYAQFLFSRPVHGYSKPKAVIFPDSVQVSRAYTERKPIWELGVTPNPLIMAGIKEIFNRVNGD